MIIRLSNRAVRPLTVAALVLGALAAPVLATQAAAQLSMPQPPPQIVVSGRGEVQVAPDRAQVQVGMETQAKTAVLASQENNRKQAAILAAIRALGIPASQIQTLNYSVMPIQRYDETAQRVVIDGYQVSNIVQVLTDKIEQAGPIIDAALTNGGNLFLAVGTSRMTPPHRRRPSHILAATHDDVLDVLRPLRIALEVDGDFPHALRRGSDGGGL